MNRLRFSIELTAFAARSTLDVSEGPVAADDVLSQEVRLIERLPAAVRHQVEVQASRIEQLPGAVGGLGTANLTVGQHLRYLPRRRRRYLEKYLRFVETYREPMRRHENRKS
jgi:hypothetical protein